MKIKNKFGFFLSIFVLLVFLSMGCSGVADSSGVAEITMTTKANYVQIYMKGTGEYTIDWGDGTEETDFFDNLAFPYHSYNSGAAKRTISIVGENITSLDCSGNQLVDSFKVIDCKALVELDCSDNELKSLNVSGCSALDKLYCFNNKLKSINIKWLYNLKLLDLEYNEMSPTALNDLFGMLPDRSSGDGIIFISYNDREYNCDESIAEAKGWTVDY